MFLNGFGDKLMPKVNLFSCELDNSVGLQEKSILMLNLCFKYKSS